ncbi:uncharacterized protein LY89DRAFT_715183 [Mollisia scopiformis]|uniref:Uncharacterized protein n=1 Tax=Mollisia scopiformis TaxID=149040 RepID=A0A194XKW1_MOLSC|nr:uncharacterized protein LY89DRAFT_715183 [Mollisia scopiformis]KUJ20870.1 hypothetical protein LY89DRAFT_715183 [Mollisia scopiformis]
MTEWLRPVFGRARTPMPSTGSDRPASFSYDESTESEESRPRPASRVSSYIGLRPSTPPAHDPDTFPNFRKPDNVYHQPSGDQMAEMLKVAMMSQSSFAPLPIEYNSCVLHVLEAYQAMRMEIGRKEDEIQVMKHKHTEAIKDFEDMATQWEAREKDYKAELKKLEVILSQTEGGMEKVTLARSKSTVHGSKRIKEVVRSSRPIKQRDSELARSDISTPTDDGRTIYIQNSGMPRHKKKNRKQIEPPVSDSNLAKAHFEVPARNQILDSQLSSPALQTATDRISGSARRNSTGITQARLEALHREQALRQLGVAFNSESESSDSSSDSEALDLRVPEPRYRVEKDLQESLLETPQKTPARTLRRGASDQTDSPKTAKKNSSFIPTQMGFSFRSGDDLDILGQRSSLYFRRRMSQETRQNLSGSSEQKSETKGVQETSKQSQPKSSIPKPKLELVKRSISPELSPEESKGLRRYDSTSSVLTAFRANSGRNSSDGSQRSSIHPRRTQGSERRGGSSDAITAATRAVASSRSDDQKNSSETTTSDYQAGTRSWDGNRNGSSLEHAGGQNDSRNGPRSGGAGGSSNGEGSSQMIAEQTCGSGSN